MKRALSLVLAACALLGALLAGPGCSTVTAQTVNHGVVGKKRIFVQSNQNDNNALDAQIVAALKARGYEADRGPLTMMPDDTEVVVTYEDHWSWDFGDRLAFLQINARDRRTGQPYGTAHYRAKIPGGKSVDKIIGELIDRIAADAKR